MAADIDRRAYVTKLYRGPDWKKKVAKMSDSQVFAIYMREQDRREAEKKAAKKASTNDDIPF